MPHRPFMLVLGLLLLSAPAFAQTTALTRERVPLPAWKFSVNAAGAEKPGSDDRAWADVTLPHTWNSRLDMKTHKAAWYRTRFTLGGSERGREIFLCFDGAATVADVFLNGVRLGQHRGAYTRFVFNGTRAAVFGGENVLAVRCDTDPKDTADCLPAGNGLQLYHVYGGLYRRVWLLKTDAVHIDPTDAAASGVFLAPQNVSAAGAGLAMTTLVRNDGPLTQTVQVRQTVLDADGQTVAVASGTVSLGPNSSGAVSLHTAITRPHLWSTTDPYLYHVDTELNAGGRVTDALSERTGFRFFQMTPTGFFLNGVRTPLRGVAKHQETEERASAVSNDDLRRDWDDLRDLGVNYVRLAHYPHAELEYDLADERGVVVWAENGHSNVAPATATGDRITREMVRQLYNHPSICFWSVGNEAIGKKTQKADIATLERYAAVARAEDPSRLITYASSTTFHQSPALDFVAVNRYPGWYGGLISDFPALAAKYHWISETGAGGVRTTHTASALPRHIVNVYEPEEYQEEVAESRCQTAFGEMTDQIPLWTWWTFRDFADPRYKGLNTKGLETYGGFRKDIWYLFQSWLRPQTPVVHLCGKPWFLRRAQSLSDRFTIKAYANTPALTLRLNGEDVGTAQNGDYVLPNGTGAGNVFGWDIALRRGRNDVVVDDGQGHTDGSMVYFEAGDEGSGLVRTLTSSNPLNPAFFLARPVEAEWPVYDDFDGTADNTFARLPDILQGAYPIVTSRLSKPGMRTDLSFTLAPDAGTVDVFVLWTRPAPADPRPPDGFTEGFTDTGIGGTWRDNALSLVPFTLSRRIVEGGTTVRLPGAAWDYTVLLKPHTPTSEIAP